MEIKKSWKLIFILILYITHPLLGCDVRWFGSDCQDNYRCSNESWYKRDSVVSHCEDDRKLEARALSRFPHEVIRNESEESLNMSQTNFTKNLNTCPVKESVELMCFSNITNRCEIGWFEPQCQDKCSSRNDSIVSFVNEAKPMDSSRDGKSTVRSCPRDF
ncbi:uncharacterized protein LOC131934829 [Physella acuta]|uniref:uncharacterized protein LOC131934829 n=1 Tax=Physella acuta TaxID=109671 RepID=UPI0027DD3D8E|nr:uncharacterized protein LOC131934829 [Physella acuta]